MLGRHLSSAVSAGTRRLRRSPPSPAPAPLYYAVRLVSSAKAAGVSTRSSSEEDKQHYDVLIVGGGAVGSALASCLLRSSGGSGLRIGLLEFSKGPRPLSAFAAGGDLPNARAYALSPASLQLINNGLPHGGDSSSSSSSSDSSRPGPIESLSSLSPYARISPYVAMQIWESDGPATLHFDAADLSTDAIDPYNKTEGSDDGLSETSYNDMLGAVVEDGPLVSALWDDMRSDEAGDIDLITNAAVKSIVAPSTATTSTGTALAPPPPVILTYQIHSPTPDASADAILRPQG